jgi:HK97 family phage prohead protease
MAQSKKEIRTLPIVELRVSSAEEENFIEGHAAVFDSWSETLGGIFPFKEKVKRGAFASSLEKDDIRALFNHDPNYVLGRNKAGTLQLKEDERGLFVKIFPPETAWAKDLRTSISRGDINQMSFGFTVEEDEWRYEGGYDVRELRKVKLFDVSPVTFPAYTATDVGVRAMESYQEYRAQQEAEQQNADKKVADAKNKQDLQGLIHKFKNI